ncbi:hypothetical protein MKX73_17740 [Solibacillus sp. FSL W7-1436]|uniref:hypothetical protein n=1 Tax=Solibacillus sp. FSL W7-1436 TaxID=2921705 RepID=UPI0030F64C49
MSLTLFLFMGLVGVFFLTFLKAPLMNLLGEDNFLISKLNNAEWFQNYWLAGIFLFIANAILFFSTALLLYVLSYFLIPYVHLLVMILAVIGSIFLWMTINKTWHGTRKNRLKMAAVGSSFYLILSIILIYMFVTLEPSFPGDDPFMRAIGLLMGIVVTTVAFLSCFIFTGFSNRKEVNGARF